MHLIVLISSFYSNDLNSVASECFYLLLFLRFRSVSAEVSVSLSDFANLDDCLYNHKYTKKILKS